MSGPYAGAWQRIRAAVLAEEPLCPGVPAGVHRGARVPTTQVDHVSGDNHDNRRSNLRGICGPCNQRKSVEHEGSGGQRARWRGGR